MTICIILMYLSAVCQKISVSCAGYNVPIIGPIRFNNTVGRKKIEDVFFGLFIKLQKNIFAKEIKKKIYK